MTRGAAGGDIDEDRGLIGWGMMHDAVTHARLSKKTRPFLFQKSLNNYMCVCVVQGPGIIIIIIFVIIVH
jgi:hypothetical protein